MIYDEIRKANMDSMKQHDKVAHSIFSLLLGKMNLVIKENKLDVLQDIEASNMISKMIKELTEEHDMYAKGNKEDKANDISRQRELLMTYLPKQLSKEEVQIIISQLEDKTIPAIMKYFKIHYNGLVDMKLVNMVVKEI